MYGSLKSIFGTLVLLVLATGGARSASAFPLEVADAPTNNLDLILSAIRSAQYSLLVNIYEFSEPAIADALQERIAAGVHVEILQEGQPVGGISASARAIQSQLIAAMLESPGGDRYFEMHANADRKTKRRYRFNHAKYMVVDGESLYIGSENYSPSGHPVPGTKGNRGWDAFLHDPAIANAYARTFNIDTDTSFGDVVTHVSGDGVRLGCFLPAIFCGKIGQLISFEGPQQKQVRTPYQPPLGVSSLDARAVEQVTSPETSRSGLLRLIENARSTLDIEQMNFNIEWKKEAARSPLLNSIIEAAQRGVQVRVLLNDDAAFIPGGGYYKDTKNKQMVRELNWIARDRQLPIYARIAKLRAMGVGTVHNKGALADGRYTLISSINWNENSVMNNREAAVILDSEAVNAYFQGLFDQDWKVSSRFAGRSSEPVKN